MIVAIDHGGEIALHIPSKLEHMVSTGRTCFAITQQSINPLELGQISGFATSDNDNCMGTAGIRYAVEARESIGQHLALGIECSARPAFYCGTGKARNHRKSRIDGMTLCIYRDGGHKVDFVLGTSSDLAAGMFPAQIGIIGLYSALQSIDFLAFEHRLHQLVVDAPGRGIADTQLSHQGGECGQTRLCLTNQVNGEKPSRQGQAGALKEGSGNPGSLDDDTGCAETPCAHRFSEPNAGYCHTGDSKMCSASGPFQALQCTALRCQNAAEILEETSLSGTVPSSSP